MSGANPLPRVGDVFLDARGEDRALRLSRHEGDGLVILSLWRRGVCTGTFRLPDTDLPDLLGALTELTERTELAEPCAATCVDPAAPAEHAVPAEGAVRAGTAVRGEHADPAGRPLAPDRLVFPVTDEHPRLPSPR